MPSCECNGVEVARASCPCLNSNTGETSVLQRPLPREDFDGGAGHVDVVVFSPVDVEVSAGEVDEEFSAGFVGDSAGDARAIGDEAHLIERLIRRDEAAFNGLVRSYQQRVFALLVRMIGSRAEAEDLAQEVFVQVFKAIGSFRGESKLSPAFLRL